MSMNDDYYNGVKPISVRDCQCLRCGKFFVREVKHVDHTQNLSGEVSNYCPKCGSKEVLSSPIKRVKNNKV